jgi:hypothetical protein
MKPLAQMLSKSSAGCGSFSRPPVAQVLQACTPTDVIFSSIQPRVEPHRESAPGVHCACRRELGAQYNGHEPTPSEDFIWIAQCPIRYSGLPFSRTSSALNLLVFVRFICGLLGRGARVVQWRLVHLALVKCFGLELGSRVATGGPLPYILRMAAKEL